ncbi:YqgE/AlgH family protein [Candidatus Venteria ishoeyi]|uniref:UPF0301 protein MBHS_04914 n=1 Tax=Candidatus Venteria ishoeyi TaxID=1899563 RepID=A0A1H6FHX1_9GAMM|nr:YqgE/AlgH family protein [Candidatus Venteria ishoeyi]MDM8548241.1 YqgE/AlgH family protein [Candidatus Venteria ishoeyi]SEH09021.1 Uncharacterised protein [Candidatus Venteria ishoeyi]
MQNTDLTNHFLIAMPMLADPNFYHTVAYVCVHGEEGAMAIVVNRPLDVMLSDVLVHMNINPQQRQAKQTPIYHGGPIEPERGFVLHRPAGDWEAMIRVSPELGITTSRDILEAIAVNKGPEQVLVALGYAGWGAGQLEKEIADNAWLSTPADPDILFNTTPARRWQAAATQMGVDLTLLSTEAGHG